MEQESTRSPWAKSWLREVLEAKRALDRAVRMAREKEARAFSLGSGALTAGPSGKARDPMEKVRDKVDFEARLSKDSTYVWATATLGEFDRMKAALRPALRGPLGLGLDAAEMRYRNDYKIDPVARCLGVSRNTVKTSVNAFIDYLDYLGRARAIPHEGEASPDP